VQDFESFHDLDSIPILNLQQRKAVETTRNMMLHVIDYPVVRADLDTGVLTKFNTNFHTADEAPDLPIPTNAPTSFERWLPLVMRRRNLPSTALQVVGLSKAQVRTMVQAQNASIHTKVLSRAYAEDLEDEVRPAFASLSFPPQGLFMRLDACSAKDGTHSVPGKMAVSSAEEVVLALSTSDRVRSAMTKFLASGDESIRIYLLPFDERIRTEREYRVFCVPGTLRITGLSQYRWHEPWMFANRSEEERSAIVQKIWKGISEIRNLVIDSLRGGNEMDDLLRAQGFTFDVLFDEERSRCELIELNTFGVRSACGSCLFHWVADRGVLYGEGSDEAEFRVTM
jgi:hypothetical protein